MEPEILYEDNHLIAVNKPAGLLTQSDRSGDPSLLDELKAYIRDRDKKPGNVFLGMVHRLDRPVSGAIIFAKTSKAASRISEQIRKHRFEKIYVAVSDINPGAQAGFYEWTELKDNLLRIKDKTFVTRGSENKTQEGVLKVRTLWIGEKHGVHLVCLETGRKHQIRVQLAHAGWPLSGDMKYGSNSRYPKKRGIGLHSYFCRVKHPVRQEKVAISARLPTEMLHCFSSNEAAEIMSMLEREIEALNI